MTRTEALAKLRKLLDDFEEAGLREVLLVKVLRAILAGLETEP